MAAAYSTRFILVNGVAGSFTVPQGKRAVIKCVTLVNESGAVINCGLRVAGILAFHRACPASTGAEAANLMIVAEPGQSISIASGASLNMHVSGYLLDAGA